MQAATSKPGLTIQRQQITLDLPTGPSTEATQSALGISIPTYQEVQFPRTVATHLRESAQRTRSNTRIGVIPSRIPTRLCAFWPRASGIAE